VAFLVKFLKVTGALFRRYQLLVILVVEQYIPYKVEGRCKGQGETPTMDEQNPTSTVGCLP
jgi:hypothetical protein